MKELAGVRYCVILYRERRDALTVVGKFVGEAQDARQEPCSHLLV
jgi:hypothetical protein